MALDKVIHFHDFGCVFC